MRAVRARVEELLPLKNLPPEVLSVTATCNEPGRLADLVASNLKLRVAEAQEVLEIVDPIARLRKVDALLRRELDVTSVQAEIQSQAHDEMTRSQREHFLREQLRAIQAELGEGDGRLDEADEYRAQARGGGHARGGAWSRRAPAAAPRAHAPRRSRGARRAHLPRLDGRAAVVAQDAGRHRARARAKAILDEDHAHLNGIKERILEFLGVRKLRGDSRGPILCFVGPPGVGKTSLGRSIARAMGREFVRISLGGVRDEAEIRGHRRTYVGAMPGRDHPGPEAGGHQQPRVHARRDRQARRRLPRRSVVGAARGARSRAEQPLQRSLPERAASTSRSVLFIATANLLDPIPGPLRDRMEVIRIAGYTPEEKVEIARSFLIPRQLREYGLAAERLRWSRGSRARADHRLHAGGGRARPRARDRRGLRKVARRAAEGDGAARHGRTAQTLARAARPAALPARRAGGGPARWASRNGLAWTESGGEVLHVEATMTPGAGLVLTGQLGDVMKESGQAALTWARGRGAELGFDAAMFGRHEIHVHVPAGAMPKDGPSAGIAIATAILSLGDCACRSAATSR